MKRGWNFILIGLTFPGRTFLIIGSIPFTSLQQSLENYHTEEEERTISTQAEF